MRYLHLDVPSIAVYSIKVSVSEPVGAENVIRVPRVSRTPGRSIPKTRAKEAGRRRLPMQMARPAEPWPSS